MHNLFTRHAQKTPAQTAVSDPRVSWTYQELDLLSNQLANRLRAGGIERGDIVAVYGHRSASLACALLGILKAGAAFCILDPAYPVPRLTGYLKVAKPRAWIGIEAAGEPPEELRAILESCVCGVTLPAGEARNTAGVLDGCPGEDPGLTLGAADLAYLTFTSGSTGSPKAVMGLHGSLTHFLPWMTQTYHFDSSDRFSLLSGLSYNQLQREVFTALGVGATLVMPDSDDIGSFERLRSWMGHEKVTVTHLTPAMGQLLTASQTGARTPLPALRFLWRRSPALNRRRGDAQGRPPRHHRQSLCRLGNTKGRGILHSSQLPRPRPQPRHPAPRQGHQGRAAPGAQLRQHALQCRRAR